MFTTTYALIGAVLIIIALFFFIQNGEIRNVHQAIRVAKSSGDPTVIIAAIRNKPLNEREDLWDQALTSLWQSYDRELAAKVLLLALNPVHKNVIDQETHETSVAFDPSPDSELKILHYWVNQVRQIEPEIANTIFTPEFMQYGFRQDLASCCGKGCCG